MLLDVAVPPTKNAAVGAVAVGVREKTSDPHHDRSRFRLFSFFVPKQRGGCEKAVEANKAPSWPSPLVRRPHHRAENTSRRGTKRETFKSWYRRTYTLSYIFSRLASALVMLFARHRQMRKNLSGTYTRPEQRKNPAKILWLCAVFVARGDCRSVRGCRTCSLRLGRCGILYHDEFRRPWLAIPKQKTGLGPVFSMIMLDVVATNNFS